MQFDFGTIDPFVVDGVQLADMLNQWRDALYSMHRGASRPSYAVPGMMWINDSAGAAAWVVNVFMGAAGDVPLFTYNTTTGAITISAAAGGTIAAAALLAQANALPSVRWDNTGNPIDTQKWRATVQADGSLRFSAFSDAGVEGNYIQFNRDGSTTTLPATQPALRLYSEHVLGALGSICTVAFPATFKRLELEYFWVNSNNADATPFVQFMVGGTPVAAGYSHQLHYAVGSTTAAQMLTAATYLTCGQTQWCMGKMTGVVNTGLSFLWMGQMQNALIQNANTRVVYNSTFDVAASGINGARFSTVGGANIMRAGSFLRCWAA